MPVLRRSVVILEHFEHGRAADFAALFAVSAQPCPQTWLLLAVFVGWGTIED